MATQTFEDKDIQYAYRSIHDFFDWYDFPSALKETEHIIKAAARCKALQTGYPYRPVGFMEKLQELVTAAFVIKNNYSSRHACILYTATGTPNLALTQNFVDRYSCSTPWNNMPRHLTAAMYEDPYIAIKKFTRYATETAWKQTGKDLAEYALTNESIEAQYPCCKLLSIRLHLLRLIEACHLVEVRSNLPKPQPKPKPKSKPRSKPQP